MVIRAALARDSRATRAAVVGWKLGLGWLIGRWMVLLTTIDDTGRRRHSLVPFVFSEGDLYTAVDGYLPWLDDVSRRPLAQAQSHPGPLAVKVRRVTDEERDRVHDLFVRRAPDLLAAGAGGTWMMLEATGDPVPEIVAPDWVWVWPGAALAAWLVRSVVRAIRR